MNDVLSGSYAPWRWDFWPADDLRIVNWNIDRGLRLCEVIDFLASQRADLLILQEVDLNAHRTHFLNVAEEIARKLQMNYVLAASFRNWRKAAPHRRPTMARRHSRAGVCETLA